MRLLRILLINTNGILQSCKRVNRKGLEKGRISRTQSRRLSLQARTHDTLTFS